MRDADLEQAVEAGQQSITGIAVHCVPGSIKLLLVVVRYRPIRDVRVDDQALDQVAQVLQQIL